MCRIVASWVCVKVFNGINRHAGEPMSRWAGNTSSISGAACRIEASSDRIAEKVSAASNVSSAGKSVRISSVQTAGDFQHHTDRQTLYGNNKSAGSNFIISARYANATSTLMRQQIQNRRINSVEINTSFVLTVGLRPPNRHRGSGNGR